MVYEDVWCYQYDSNFISLFPFTNRLQTEPFYQVIWKDENKIIRAAESPSVKQIKEYIIGMKLDDELWELLQDPGNREYLRNCIIKHYLS